MKLNEIVGLNPEQKLFALAISYVCEWNKEELPEIDSVEDFDEFLDEFRDQNDAAMYDAMSEIRTGGTDTSLRPVFDSRHYEIDSTAVKVLDGTWVEFPYIHGGGKHSNPEEQDWHQHARNVTVTFEERVVKVPTFKLVD